MAQNLFLETGFEPDDATVLAMEADAGGAIAGYIRQRFPNNQNAAARHLRIGQNEVSAILAGNLGRFSLPKLIRIARRAGLRLYFDMGETADGACATSVSADVQPIPSVASGVEYPDELMSSDVIPAARPVAGLRRRVATTIWQH